MPFTSPAIVSASEAEPEQRLLPRFTLHLVILELVGFHTIWKALLHRNLALSSPPLRTSQLNVAPGRKTARRGGLAMYALDGVAWSEYLPTS